MYPLPAPTRLDATHVSSNARLYATRDQMLSDLVAKGYAREGGHIVEIGVAFGDFSRVLIATCKPRQFSAFDIFRFHEVEEVFGRAIDAEFGGRTHREFYEQTIRSLFPALDFAIYEGDGARELQKVPSASIDLVYIDANHDLDAVEKDAAQALRIVRPDGVIIFNDYIMIDHLSNTPYGVVQVANQIVSTTDWRIVGLSLNPNMFCDLAIVRG